MRFFRKRPDPSWNCSKENVVGVLLEFRRRRLQTVERLSPRELTERTRCPMQRPPERFGGAVVDRILTRAQIHEWAAGEIITCHEVVG